jgi:hypothetical protein
MRHSLNRRLQPAIFLLFSLLILAMVEPCLAQASEEGSAEKTAENEKKGEKKHREKPYALIFGTVWGPDKRPVYGVKIKCRRAGEKKTRWELYSDHSGEFAIRVPAGKQDYVISADMSGFKSLNGKHFQNPPEVTVHIENDERTDIGVHLN